MKNLLCIIGCILLIVSCQDTTDDGINTNIPAGEIPDEIEGVQLIFPLENELCTTGTNITDSQSTVLFEWVPNNNAISYTITVINLDTNDTIETETDDFLIPITIERANSFRWFVSYAYNGETYTSESWNFYNAGEGIVSYPPFPAEIISPMMAENIASTNTISLQWNGTDIDNDIVSYDVYFGTESDPSLQADNITSNTLSVTVNSDTIYYWYVVTWDEQGNSSETSVHQFKVL